MKIRERQDKIMKDYQDIPDYANELLVASSIGIDQLLQKLKSLLSLPITITDPLYNVLFSSDITINSETFSCSVFEEMNTTNHNNARMYQIQTIDNKMVGLAAPIISKNTTFGFLFILGEDPMEIYQYSEIAKFTASLCAIQMQKQQEMNQEKVKYKVAFLFDLLYGNMKQREDIIEYGNIWGWNFNNPHQTIVFSLTDFNHFSAEKQILNRIHSYIGKILSDCGKIPITLIKQNQVIVIYPLQTIDDPVNSRDEVKQFSHSVINYTHSIYPEYKVVCGIGKVYSNPTELFRSFQEAKVAYDLGILLNIDIPFFSELGLERILYKHDLQDLKEYYETILGDLEKYDAVNDGDLMETLEAFAANHFDITQTSKALFLHRNTLRYRLKRIEEILNIKLEDFNIKLDISAAFKIKQLHQL
ncbi:helix-turn-helix domain-containing protein [Schinkia azotoformans]